MTESAEPEPDEPVLDPSTLDYADITPPENESAAALDPATALERITTQIEPYYDRVLVLPDEADTETGGHIITTAADDPEQPCEGMVLAVGEGAIGYDGRLRALRTRPGDRVLYGQHSGTKITVDGIPLLMFREAELLGRRREPDTQTQTAQDVMALNDHINLHIADGLYEAGCAFCVIRGPSQLKVPVR